MLAATGGEGLSVLDVADKASRAMHSQVFKA